LKNLGFKGNPFASLEAGKEEGEEWFYASFVEPPRFSEILGDAASPQPVLVFAPRGSGKTALRVMLDYYCRRGYIPGGRILSILHTDLSLIQEVALKDSQADLARYHVQAILRAGSVALAQQIETNLPLRERLASQQPEERTYLHWFVLHFSENLLPSHWRCLREVGLVERGGIGFQAQQQPTEVPALQELLESDSPRSYVTLLEHFVHLMRGLDFQAVYILVDGADELAQTASEFGYAARLVEPLAANLKLLDIPGVAFRLFLPAEVKPYLEAQEAVRHDRVLWHDLKWNTGRLLELLHKRLLVFSDYHIESLDQICVDTLRGGRLELEMVEACSASPRTLLRLGNELISQQAALVGGEQEDWRIQEKAWERAREAVLPGGKDRPPTVPAEPPPVAVEDARELLFQQVRRDYPGPIALTFRDYLIQPEPLHKLQRLLDSFEISLGFCGVLMMAQYCQQVKSAQGRQPKSLAQVLGSGYERIALGTWHWILTRLTGVSGSLGKTVIGTHLHRLLTGESGKAIERLITLRNQVAHGALRNDEAYYRQQLVESDGLLVTVLQGLAFLSDVRLIRADNLRRQGAQYVHRARLYRGDNPNFPWVDIYLQFPLDCDKILAIYRDIVLLLHPLLVAERCPECGQEELFLYQRLDGEEVTYHAFSSGHTLITAKNRADIANLLGI
jgi:hypothetical protein